LFIKKQRDKMIKKLAIDAETKEIKKVINQLCFYGNNHALAVLYNALEEETFVPKIEDGYILKNGVTFVPMFSFDGLSKTDVLKAFNYTEGKTIIFTADVGKDVLEFSKRFNGKIIIKNGKKKIIPNMCGLEVSQKILKDAISEVDFTGYNSKTSLLHQLFRRNSLINFNNLSR
jgi:hypothetical protein